MFWFEPVLVWFGSVLVWFVSFRFVFFGPRGVLVLLGASEVLVIVKLLVAILGGASLPFPSLEKYRSIISFERCFQRGGVAMAASHGMEASPLCGGDIDDVRRGKPGLA